MEQIIGEINAILIDPEDNVAVALRTFEAGDTAVYRQDGRLLEVCLAEAVPMYHKFAVADITAQAPVFKYGQVIGKALCAIPKGSHVHSHNLASLREGIEE